MLSLTRRSLLPFRIIAQGTVIQDAIIKERTWNTFIVPRFGVARKYGQNLLPFLQRLAEERIDAYEMGFAFGVPDNIPDEVKNFSRSHNILLTAHLPLWINLSSQDTEKNIKYLVKGLRISYELGSIIIFHMGFYNGKRWEDIRERAAKIIRTSLERFEDGGMLGIETTGKRKALGSLEEVLDVVKLVDDERVVPVIDWAHLYARNNGVYPKTYEDFLEILERFEKELGYKPFHFHGGGIEYRNGNEVRHLSARTNEPPLPFLFAALKDLGYRNFTFIVESPTSIEDIRWLREVWKKPEDFFEEVPKGQQRLF